MKRLLLAALFVTSPAFASYVNGIELIGGSDAYDRMENPAEPHDPWAAAQFAGYVLGVAEAIKGVHSCPTNVKAGKIIEVVQKYLKAHQDRLRAAGVVLVTNALSEAFPCSK